ncbi:HAF repeat-containing protein [Herpetosiphon llansteffanensis]
MLVGRKIVAGGLLVASLVGLSQLQAPAVHAQTPTPTNPGYTSITIGSLGGHDGYASDINDFGRVSGYAETESSDYRGFMWRRGTKTEISPLMSGENEKSYAYGINDTGYVVGESTFGHNQTRAFYWRGGGNKINLGTLGGPNSVAIDVSNGERIIGNSDTANGESHAFMWYRGTMTDLGTLGGTTSSANEINDHKVIVGSSTNANGQNRAVIWKNGQIIDLNVPAIQSFGNGINNHEHIVGTMVLTDGIPRAFVWDDGVTTDLSTGTDYTYANDINDAGIVVGRTYDDDGNAKATVWRNGTVLYLWEGSSGMSTSRTNAVAINEANQVVGYDDYDDTFYFFTDAMLWQLTE